MQAEKKKTALACILFRISLSRPAGHFPSERWITFVRDKVDHFPSEFPFYGNGKSILVLPYLNGEAVTFSGLEQVHGPFYRWEDVGSRIRDILRRS